MLGLHSASVVSADTLVELLWGEDPPRTAAKALQTHISSLRRTLGDGFILTQGAGWTLAESEVDVSRYKAAARLGRDAAAAGDISQAVARFEEALALWRGIPELPDGRRGTSEKTRWIEGHAALVEDRADVLLATGRAAEIVGELEAAVADAPLRERRWGQLMLALYRAGRQGEALGAYQRARALLADELGVDPGPDLRRLEAAIVAQDTSLEIPAAQQPSVMMRAVTFLLTDIEGSTAAWEAEADAMAVALARHDELVEQVVTSRGGRLIKTRGEGDATFSVFERPSAAASAAIELQEAIVQEPWALREPMRIRVALHTGEAELRDGDYFGRAVNRAARLRSLAVGGQILCSGATAELVIDSLADDVVLADLGMRELRNLARPEHVFELRLEIAETQHPPVPTDVPVKRPSLPAVLAGPGPFVGRGRELERLFTAWQAALAGGTNAVLIAGEPGVGKTRLAGEWSRQAYDQGALVIYGRCDEDLGAPYQPFAEALRSLVPCLGTGGLRGLRGVEALLALVPGLSDVLPDLATPTRADPDTERYALFDAVVALLGIASAGAPIILILDDLHWAAKPTLLLLRHLLRFGEHARVQIVATYRSTDLDRSHPLAAMLADLHRDGTANRLQLGGLDEDDVSAYVAEAGYDDEELARALASVTGGNPFFLIEALRHVDESGGRWDQSTLPQGVREAVSRRLSRLAPETNKALAAAAVVGSRFALDLVESVVGEDLVDALDEACKAGIVIEEPGGRYRFNHAIVRQSLLAELPSVRRMRLHQRIATTLESEPGADDELLAELAHHYFECAWAGNAAKAVEYCRRAADQAMTRLAYEGAADLYDRALHALEEIDDELPDRDDQTAELLIARCEALLAAGDVASAAGAVSQLQGATVDSARLAAWATCFDGQLSMLTHPERLEEVEAAVSAAADKLAELGDAAGEASAHTVRAGCLARLGRIGDAEIALDDALTAARRASEHRRVNAVLANAPLAALWGPNPVPRAGGRCLDVVRLLRITTDSPAVEATSTRCQAVLEAFRGRAAAARRMIDSARRTVSELGLRHALLEVEQFAGIVELVVDDPVAAEPHLRKAYNGFRRMGIDVCTAETAALLGRACLVLDRDAEADELCTESERLAGSALKASIAWRTLRAHLLARRGKHDEARRAAEAAVSLAERTDALVDHGDACLTLATVLGAAGDAAGARAAAERAADLYERKGAAALAQRARPGVGAEPPSVPALPEAPRVELDNACVRAVRQLDAAYDREAWEEIAQLVAGVVSCDSHRKIVGFSLGDLPYSEWECEARRYREMLAEVRYRHVVLAVRGERLALTRLEVGPADMSPGAPRDELLQLYGIDEEGRIALQVWFDVEDVDAAIAELDAAYARFEEEHPRAPLENAATRAYERLHAYFAARDWNAITELLTDDYYGDDRRSVVGSGMRRGPDAAIEDYRSAADIEVTEATSETVATRGERLALTRARYSRSGQESEGFHVDFLQLVEIDTDEQIAAMPAFDLDDLDAAIAELDARYLAGEASAHARTWSVITGAYAALNRHEIAPATANFASIDHRRGTRFAPGDLIAYVRATWDLAKDGSTYIEAVHRLDDLGAVVTHVTRGSSRDGFDAEWREVFLLTVEGDRLSRCELFDEADTDTAIARFEELDRPASKLENTASRVFERLYSYVAVDDWHAVAQITAENVSVDDRRRVVNAGILHGRDANIRDAQATADVGFTMAMVGVLATRGGLLALTRVRVSGRDPEAIESDALSIIEVDAEERIAAVVVFDLDDFDDAIAELDARYLAGEGATHTRTWSIITDAYAALNRHEIAATTTDFASIDHRRGARFAPGDLIAYVRSGWELDQHISTYIERIHQLTDVGAVITHVVRGGPQEGLDAEWREAILITVDGDVINRSEMFDERDVDAALARFEELNRPVPRRLENAASRMYERFKVCFAARDWPGVKELYADNILSEDRRHPINSGVRQGPDALVAEMSAIAEVGIDITTSAVATRGEHLVLSRIDGLGRDQGADGFQVVALDVLELDADERFAARILFNLDDFDAAVAELDARYIAGEAAPYAQTWSVIAASYAAINRHEQPPTTPDWVNVDHRREVAMGPDDLVAYISAGLDSDQDITTYVETVHCLNRGGAVLTYAAQETSREGFNAEWRGVVVLLVSGDKVSRSELFDETDLDAAVVRFEQLSRTARRLENAASQITKRFFAYFGARDWNAMATILAENVTHDDRRHVVNAGVLHGRDAQITNLRAIAEVGVADFSSTVIAVRGARLALVHISSKDRDKRPENVLTEELGVVEINSDNRMAAYVAFDLDDFDAAMAELDARYLAGEAAPHAHTWSIVASGCAALNRRESLPTTPDWVNNDHRRGIAFNPGDLTAYISTAWNLLSNGGIYIETAHRLNDLGAVFTWRGYGTSQEGSDVEFRGINMLSVEGDLISRVELFDEADLDAALAKFDQLSRPTPRLENAASQAYERFRTYFAARDWDAMAELLAADTSVDDHRRVVNAEIRRGRDVEIANMQAFAGIGATRSTATVIATRGERLVLCRTCISGEEQQPGAFNIEFLNLVEITADKRIAARSAFDLDDIDAAFKELDTRYLAGEAASHAHTWSVIAGAFAAINRHELPELAPDWIDIDHRRGAAFASGEMIAYIRDLFDNEPDFNSYITVVHRLTELGAVVTMASHGTSQQGFQAEWREIGIFTFDGDLLNRCELFDEADLDAALARFEELRPHASRLETVANRMLERYQACFSAPDWAAMAELLADDIVVEDRRRVVNAGVRRGRDVHIADLRSAVEVGAKTISLSASATRGERLALAHARAFNRDMPGEVGAEWLGVVEVDADQRIVAIVTFDVDDIDAAIDELDARYLAGDAAPYARVWKRALDILGEVNRHEPGPMIERLAFTDHRRVSFADGDFRRAIEELWPLVPDARYRVTAVHALDAHGVVASLVIEGTDAQGNELQWTRTLLLDPDEPRLEIYEESDLDRALARFEELRPEARRLENAASRVIEQFLTRFADRDWDAMAELLAEDMSSDDRRRVINAGIRRGRDAEIANWQATAEIWKANARSTVIAIRGERLALFRIAFTSQDQPVEAFQAAALAIIEINEDNRGAANVVFDIDDIDAAFAELDARYLAGEAATCAHAFSVVARAYAAANRHELAGVTPDSVFVDHRPVVTTEAEDLAGYLRGVWDLIPDIGVHIEAVHRLSECGGVITHAARGISHGGFDAEWRTINVFTVEGDMLNRVEVYDESDLGAALARFAELNRPVPHLDNAATRARMRTADAINRRDVQGVLALNVVDARYDDRRKGLRDERAVGAEVVRAIFEAPRAWQLEVAPIAIRGSRLALTRDKYRDTDDVDRPITAEHLMVTEVGADGLLCNSVLFDPGDINAAFVELDARYLAGAAAAYARTWSVIMQACAALNRREIFETSADFVDIDHRPLAAIGSGDLKTYMHAALNDGAYNVYVEAVHRLSDLGAVVTLVSNGTSQAGFEGEWRMADIFTVEGDLISRCEIFDEADLDAALARFEELHSPTRRLENAASLADDRFFAHTRTRNWAAARQILADSSFVDDRRRVVNIGVWDGRDTVIANIRALADALTDVTSMVIAIRGERLGLTRISAPNRKFEHGDFRVEMLCVVELDTDDRIAAHVMFDPDDIDPAFEELEARYLAGEAALHSHTWSVVTRSYGMLNRRELPPRPDFIDHRRGISVAPNELTAFIGAAWELERDICNRIENVHRISKFGAVVTRVSSGTSQDGLRAEWRSIDVLTVDGDLVNRFEIFDEADLDAALARFDELHPQPSRLENAASQVSERFWTHFAARDWEAMAELTADNICSDDRRRVVNGGVRHGREAHIADMRVIAEIVDPRNLTPTVIATRGDHLALSHIRSSNRVVGPDEISAEVLSIVEINGDDRIVANVGFDIDDIDAAFEELDARYLAGEAAAHAPIWSVIAAAYAALNRHELPATKSDWVTIDHRVRESFQGGDLTAYIRSAWEVAPDLKIYIETVHRLSNHGAVVTHAAYGTSPGGFDAEWRIIGLLAVGRNWVNRCELFDEADLDAALAHFEELQRPARRLENAASRADDRFFAYFWARNWAALGEILADETFIDDRRPVVNAGLWHGRDVVIANLRAVADAAAIITSVIATRGERLALSRMSSSNRDPRQGEFRVEMLNIVEIDTEGRIVAHVDYDVNDIDAAFAELDARYLAGEAAAHARTWSVIAGGHAGFNRQESAATTPDVVYVDRRPVVSLEGVELGAAQRAVWDLTPDATGYVEAVHRLSEFGTVITQAVTGTSQEGFAAEWRMIAVCMVEGDLLCRYEVFDEADLDAALARFDELHPETRRLENAASQAAEGLWGCFAARDWAEMAETMADDIVTHDHRRVVNADVLHGRDAHVTNMQAVAEVGFEGITSTVVATRGQRLALIRIQSSIHGFEPGEMSTEMLSVVEVDGDNRLTASAIFDGDDIDAALARLEARYLEGEAAPYVQVWSAITEGFAVLSRGEIPAITPEFEDIDRRSGPTMAPGDLIEFLRAAFADSVGITMYVEAVHRLTGLGAVVTHVAKGTSQTGFDAEWRMTDVFTVEGDRVSRCEFFDEADLDAALARFDQLDRPAPTA
ncbi:hypothetical protein A5747_05800 [Mycobacterium sp. IS-836]|uniref:BTAD domain-containing putative transcriptional regulator n=1 Tax=Mycobacterium sp. IS-836 TaxID=1834160 RepID=UPI00096FD45B|nr:hypothetical protein A5747_05800 [Mycobacterium sp. IS-836]